MGAPNNEVPALFLSLFLACFSLLPVSNINAATFTVTQISDSDCSDLNCDLQAALNLAQSNGEPDTIEIAPGTYNTSGTAFTYTAGAAENFALTIAGVGAGPIELDGGEGTQVLKIDTFANLPDDGDAHITIRNLTIQNGNNAAGFGGGVFVCTGFANVNLESSKLSNNSASSEGSAFAGDRDASTKIRTTRRLRTKGTRPLKSMAFKLW